MARIKLSPIIASINGKVGNAVFQTGKSGTILRERVIPRNRNTVLQRQKRNLLQTTKSEWQTLSTDQKNSWVALAAFMLKKQKHSATRSLTAYELFIQSNFIRNQSEIPSKLLTTLETATIISWYQEVDTLTALSFKMYLETSTQGAVTYSAFYISKPFRQSSAIAKSSVRYIDSIYDNFGTLDLTDNYKSLFGSLPVSGQKVLIKRVAFLPNSGWISKVYYEEIIL